MRLHSNKLTRDELLSRHFPDFTPVEDAAVKGLSGGSCLIEYQGQRLVLRQHHDSSAPDFHFRRQYHALKALPATLAPRPLGFYAGWMAVEYLQGETCATLPDSQPMAALLYHLHQQKGFGWRVTLLPLLQHYWQNSSPLRRTPQWLRVLQRLRKQGEPQPLRLAPLHMDVHAGNLVMTKKGLRLIDWEYAGDGDVALELAAVWTADETSRAALIAEYARVAKMDATALGLQVQRWQPWLNMLMTTWYEYRWQQTGEQHFIALADEGWRDLMNKREER
ncbi:thiamine kinase [Scandinavium sp. NPDC088450]|uniref:thiamine kinase n=1 Tax=Scandinavium sp. NPDC088450 TaxID=3364514 RepID=UPI00385094ED